MIVLDTNIISEMMKSIPDPKILSWIDKQEISELFITTVTIAEISYGIDVLPEGKRREALEEAFNKTLEQAFCHRVLSFDQESAYLYGKIMGKRKLQGRPLSILDGQIAAIACFHDFSIVTRNERDFIGCNINVINPFL